MCRNCIKISKTKIEQIENKTYKNFKVSFAENCKDEFSLGQLQLYLVPADSRNFICVSQNE